MQFFPVGRVYDFMGKRRLFAGISVLMTVISVVALFVPGPSLGTDFRGGTEVEVEFLVPTEPGAIREAVTGAGLSAPEVIPVTEGKAGSRYLIRVQEVSSLGPDAAAGLSRALCVGEGLPEAECPAARRGSDLKVSPGGDKVTLRFADAPDLEWVKSRVSAVPGVSLRESASNPSLQNARENKVEIQLKSRGDQLMSGLREKLGAEVVPESPLRVEWIGPKAGAQLRDSALKSIAIAIVFIMAYIAVRFDLRFAPGAVVSMVHDAVGSLGVLILLHREINLTTVAAILTILGYSVNDTVVVYDRVRENFGLLRGATFERIINVSISEMLGRTLLTGSTTVLSLLAFFFWGTGPLKDFALALIVGILLGTYSSVYIALPFTWWLDTRFFGGTGGAAGAGQKRPAAKQPAAVV